MLHYYLNYNLLNSESSNLSFLKNNKTSQPMVGGSKTKKSNGRRKDRYNKELKKMSSYIKTLNSNKTMKGGAEKENTKMDVSDEFAELKRIQQSLQNRRSDTSEITNSPFNSLMKGGVEPFPIFSPLADIKDVIPMDKNYFDEEDDDFLEDNLPNLDDDMDLFDELDDDDVIDNEIDKILSSDSEYNMTGGKFSATSDTASNMDFVPFSGEDYGFSESVAQPRF
jgi:hypothetical protein